MKMLMCAKHQKMEDCRAEAADIWTSVGLAEIRIYFAPLLQGEKHKNSDDSFRSWMACYKKAHLFTIQQRFDDNNFMAQIVWIFLLPSV